MRSLEGALCESGLGVLVWEGLVPRGGWGCWGGAGQPQRDLSWRKDLCLCVPLPSPTDPCTFLLSPGPPHQDSLAKFAVGAGPVLKALGLKS